MTTTAFDDQFTAEPEPVRQPYDTGSILRRNVADLELALKQQTERAEAAEEKLTTAREDMQSWIDSRNGWMERAGAAEAELERLREQKPVAWDCGGSITANSGYAEWFSRKDHGAAVPLYTSPVPAPAVPLQVWFGSMPESNGKTNWTAILHRGDITEGITIERSELKDRVRYEADRMRWMIGELPEEPDILKYDPELKEQSAPQTPAISVRLIKALREMKAKAYKQLDHGKGRAIFIDSNIAIDIADALLQSTGENHD